MKRDPNEFQPMLSATIEHRKALSTLAGFSWPLVGNPKYNGIRVLRKGTLYTRKLKIVPSRVLHRHFNDPSLEKMDGEMIWGDPVDPTGYNMSHRAVMGGENDIEAVGVKYYVFDDFTHPQSPYQDRYQQLAARVKLLRRKDVVLVPYTLLTDPRQARAFEQQHVDGGFEGVMLRSPLASYKFGRSTLREQYLMKWKRFVDSECEILEVYEQEQNTNELTRNELGYAKRSSAKEGKIPLGRFGGALVRDLKTKVEFNCGTGRGMTLEMRKSLWLQRKKMPGQVWKYRYQETGMKDKPLFPVLLGPRDKRDL